MHKKELYVKTAVSGLLVLCMVVLAWKTGYYQATCSLSSGYRVEIDGIAIRQ